MHNTIRNLLQTGREPRAALALAVFALVLTTTPATRAATRVDRAIADAAYLTDFEKEVLREQNLARTDPPAYAAFVEEWLRYYSGKRRTLPGRRPTVTFEGRRAVREAIEYLQNTKSMPALVPVEGLCAAAHDHVADTGPRGWMGHVGTDDSEPADRISRYGRWYQRVGENITYGGRSPRELVIRLIIDDGIPGREHRENIFNAEYRQAGMACGEHRRYGTMCVFTYAADFDPH